MWKENEGVMKKTDGTGERERDEIREHWKGRKHKIKKERGRERRKANGGRKGEQNKVDHENYR